MSAVKSLFRFLGWITPPIVLICMLFCGFGAIVKGILLRTDDPRIKNVLTEKALKDFEIQNELFIVVTLSEECTDAPGLTYQAERLSAEFSVVVLVIHVDSTQESQKLLCRVDKTALVKQGVFVKSMKTGVMYTCRNGKYTALSSNTEQVRTHLSQLTGKFLAVDYIIFGGIIFLFSLIALLLYLICVMTSSKR